MLPWEILMLCVIGGMQRLRLAVDDAQQDEPEDYVIATGTIFSKAIYYLVSKCPWY